MKSKHEDEARERWGRSYAWKESAKKTAAYGEADWDRIKAEGKAIAEGIAAAMDEGEDGAAVQAGVRAYHEYIGRSFYTCSAAMFEGLAELWGDDERFGAYWEAIRPGLTAFMRRAVRSYVRGLELEYERSLEG